MIKRTLHIGNPAYLKLKDHQLVVEYPDAPPKQAPVEDIGILVLDHHQTTLTHHLVNALLENNTVILWCDTRHMPSGLLLPLQGNNTHTEVLRAQMEATEPLKKQVWKQVVQSKIMNQAAVLHLKERNAASLKHLAGRVTSGDSTNMEAQAAGLYWKILFEEQPQFTRHRYGPPPNHWLNYGYAVLRAVVARALVGSGLHPALGIFHRNKYNPYCLADDMMEPYRPYVDLVILEMLENQGLPLSDQLDTEDKKQLLTIPAMDVMIGGQKSPLMVAVQRTTASLVKCLDGTARKLVLPEL